MGLFGKLFEKKVCSICGGEIGLLGNRKLEDGNLCKACNAKLSPFFNERRRTTVEGIREHLNYREKNWSELEFFNATRTMGLHTKLYLDEAAGKFAVSSSRNWREENADVVPLSEIAGVRVDVSDYKTEIKKEIQNAEGKTERVSYNPPRYKFSYNFHLVIEMNDRFKWFNSIRIPLNTSSIEVNPYLDAPVSLMHSVTADPRSNPKFVEAERLGEEMSRALMGSRYTPNVQTVSVDPEAETEAECAYCGSRFTADGSGKCPYCGAGL